MNLVEVATNYRRSGLCPLPTMGGKRPVTNWKQFQEEPPCEDWIEQAFPIVDGICILTGKTSGGLIAIDFDCQGEMLEPWMELIRAAMPEIVGSLVIQRTPSGGYHVLYRIPGEVPGNRKLAHKMIRCDSAEDQDYRGKTYSPIQLTDGFGFVVVPIETRGEGGLVLCYPSPSYQMVQGELTAIPTLSAEDHADIMDLTAQLDDPQAAQQKPARTIIAPNIETGIPVTHRIATHSLPGDDFSARGDIRPILIRHGWTQLSDGQNETWKRPGKTTQGHSATLHNEKRVFHNFSSEAHPFESATGYSFFQVYALLEHGGDFKAAAISLRKEGFGKDESNLPKVDLSAFLTARESDEPASIKDPGEMPDSLMHIPGFINDVVEHSLATADRPNRAISFAGALALLGHLCARKIRDDRKSRTHIFVLCLAPSGTGKDHPRQLNNDILDKVGLLKSTGDNISSAEGLEDRLASEFSMLLQIDEMGKLIDAIAKDKSGIMEKILVMLTKMYTSGASKYPMRIKAGVDAAFINQPGLSIFGTAVTSSFYASLTKSMLEDGFFGRLLIIKAGPRGEANKTPMIDVPPHIISVAEYWAEFYKTKHFALLNPQPEIIPETDEAKELYDSFGQYADKQSAIAIQNDDEATNSLWNRACEKVKKLALIYACSENHLSPQIGYEAMSWAIAFVMHQTQQMLYMVEQNCVESEFHSRCNKVVKKLQKWQSKHGEEWMQFWKIAQVFPWSAEDHEKVRKTLLNQEMIEVATSEGTKKKGLLYRIQK